MNSRHLLTALATAALITGGQALAQGRGGGQGGGNAGGHGGGNAGGMGGGNAGGMGRVDTGTMTGDVDVRGRADMDTRAGQDRGGTNHDILGRLRGGSSARSNRRANSQGPAHASDTGIENSNENSVLHDETAAAPDLTGLRDGLVVNDSSGTRIGTVSRIVTADNGRIVNVFVTDANGRQIRLAPGSLSLSGDVVTVASMGGPADADLTTGVDTRTDARANSQGPDHASDTGIANSNENSVLHDSTVTSPDLSGLETGMTVRNSAGTELGTISRIVTSDDGTIRSVLVAGADGQRRTIQLRPGTLTLSGDIVTTTDTRVNDD